MTDKSPTQVVVDFMRTWERKPLPQGINYVDPEGTVWLAHAAGATGAQPNVGTQFSILRWLQLLQPIVDSMPDGLEAIAHHMITDGEWVAVETETVGRLSSDRIYNMRYTFWYRVADGRIVEMKQYFDTKYGEAFFVDVHFETPLDVESGVTSH